jgi:uncharacterized protein YaiL (DUF2058 family)
VSTKTVFHREGYERVQDVEDIIENNKRLQNEAQDRKSNFRHVASIPVIFIEKVLREQWARGNVSLKWSSPEFDAIIKKELLDNPDYAFLRTDKRWR